MVVLMCGVCLWGVGGWRGGVGVCVETAGNEAMSQGLKDYIPYRAFTL